MKNTCFNSSQSQSSQQATIETAVPQVDAKVKDENSDIEIVFEGPLVQSTSRPVIRCSTLVKKNSKNDIPFRTITRRCHIRGCVSESHEMFTGAQLRQHIADAHGGKNLICIALPGCFETFKTQ